MFYSTGSLHLKETECNTSLIKEHFLAELVNALGVNEHGTCIMKLFAAVINPSRGLCYWQSFYWLGQHTLAYYGMELFTTVKV